MAWIIPIFAGLVVLDKILNKSEEKQQVQTINVRTEPEKKAVITKEVIGDIDGTKEAKNSGIETEGGADIEDFNNDGDSGSSSAAEQKNSNITEKPTDSTDRDNKGKSS